MRLCYVTHRYAPFPGGAEVLVQAMAEESVRRGYETWVLAGEHRGDLNGVRVTSDASILAEEFDLVIVHGEFGDMQRRTLAEAHSLPSPVLYQLVAHNRRSIRRKALRAGRFLGWSTPLDLEIIRSSGYSERARRIRHGIVAGDSIGRPGFKQKYAIPQERRMFLSCGGYWPHKRMRRLARLFEKAETDAILVLTGYDNRHNLMPRRTEKVLPLLIDDRRDVLSALAVADCYVMHSKHEGFGLVLLEAMINGTPWIAHEVGGATVLHEFGATYGKDRDLVRLIETYRSDVTALKRAKEFVTTHHLIAHTLNDIEEVVAALPGRLAAGPP